LGACTSIHRPNDDILLSFSFLLDGVHISSLAAQSGKVLSLLDPSLPRPKVGMSHRWRSLLYDQLAGLFLPSRMMRCEGRRVVPWRSAQVWILMLAEWRWHLKVTGVREWKY
jgi:hypothetical protein